MYTHIDIHTILYIYAYTCIHIRIYTLPCLLRPASCLLRRIFRVGPSANAALPLASLCPSLPLSLTPCSTLYFRGAQGCRRGRVCGFAHIFCAVSDSWHEGSE